MFSLPQTHNDLLAAEWLLFMVMEEKKKKERDKKKGYQKDNELVERWIDGYPRVSNYSCPLAVFSGEYGSRAPQMVNRAANQW